MKCTGTKCLIPCYVAAKTSKTRYKWHTEKTSFNWFPTKFINSKGSILDLASIITSVFPPIMPNSDLSRIS